MLLAKKKDFGQKKICLKKFYIKKYWLIKEFH